jgi:hypothetical protein
MCGDEGTSLTDSGRVGGFLAFWKGVNEVRDKSRIPNGGLDASSGPSLVCIFFYFFLSAVLLCGTFMVIIPRKFPRCSPVSNIATPMPVTV